MSGGAHRDGAMSAEGLPLNGTTAMGLHDREVDLDQLGFDVFSVVIVALALCILTVTGLYCITACYSRSRQSKRAQVYESAVTRGESPDPVAVRAVKRSTSFLNPLAFFRRSEAAKDNSKIYYIYSNPLPVGLKEDEEERSRTREEPATLSLPLSIQEYAADPRSGVVLDPPVFYMQL